MADVRAKIQAEFGLVDQTLGALAETLARPVRELPEWMAVAGFLLNVYNGVENVLKLALRAKGLPAPGDSPSSHRDLLDIACEKGVINAGLREALDEYRAFRHFFVHGYGVVLDPSQLDPLARHVTQVWLDFRRAIEEGLQACGGDLRP